MRIFLSWSGKRSKAMAAALHNWLPLVLHFAEPWMSERDIDAGGRWSLEIGRELEAASFGLICLTRENLNAPWILFEAGALSKHITTGKVVPYLLDVELGALSGPLSQCQAKKADKVATLDLVRAINNAKGDARVDAQRLDNLFELAWPRLELAFGAVPAADTNTPTARPAAEVLEELVATVRSFDHRLATLVGRKTADLDAPGVMTRDDSHKGTPLDDADDEPLDSNDKGD